MQWSSRGYEGMVSVLGEGLDGANRQRRSTTAEDGDEGGEDVAGLPGSLGAVRRKGRSRRGSRTRQGSKGVVVAARALVGSDGFARLS